MQMDLEKTNLRPSGDLLYTVEYILMKSNFKIQFDGSKHGSTVNALSFLLSFHTPIPLDTITTRFT